MVNTMKKFMLLFVGLELKPADADAETQVYMKKWGEWMEGLVKKGALESGSPFEWRGKVVEKDSVSDYQPPGVDIGGYMIINAASLDEAVEIAKQAPNVALGGTVVVRPCMDVKM